MARILLVEDEPLVAHMVRRMLERAGHQVDWAPSGEAALERLGEPYDLVISDLVMPGVSGLEVIRQVRAQGSTRSWPSRPASPPKARMRPWPLGPRPFWASPLKARPSSPW